LSPISLDISKVDGQPVITNARTVLVTGDGNTVNVGDNSAITKDSYNSFVNKIKNEISDNNEQKDALNMLAEIKAAIDSKDAPKAASWFEKLKKRSKQAAEIVAPWIAVVLPAVLLAL